jgi:hypothetical protein
MAVSFTGDDGYDAPYPYFKAMIGLKISWYSKFEFPVSIGSMGVIYFLISFHNINFVDVNFLPI